MKFGTLLLIAGGIYNLLFALFHIGFWRMKKFAWKEELPRMSPLNRAVIQMLNMAVIVFLLSAACISFVFPRELIGTCLGKTFLCGVALFWLVRLMGEFVFKDRAAAKTPFVVCFSVGVLLYLLPAFF